MVFQTPITIKSALDAVQCQDYVLPTIQREFTWSVVFLPNWHTG